MNPNVQAQGFRPTTTTDVKQPLAQITEEDIWTLLAEDQERDPRRRRYARKRGPRVKEEDNDR